MAAGNDIGMQHNYCYSCGQPNNQPHVSSMCTQCTTRLMQQYQKQTKPQLTTAKSISPACGRCGSQTMSTIKGQVCVQCGYTAPMIACYNCGNSLDPSSKGGMCSGCINQKYPNGQLTVPATIIGGVVAKPSSSDPLGIKDKPVYSAAMNLNEQQDDCKKVYEALPESVRLTYYLLAKYEFSNIHSISEAIAKAYKREHAETN
jgi:hypothetical protein